jgi:hypothetical protein
MWLEDRVVQLFEDVVAQWLEVGWLSGWKMGGLVV